MSTKRRIRLFMGVIGLIAATMACALPGPQASQPTATPTLAKLAPLLAATVTPTPTPGGIAVTGGNGSVGGGNSGTGGNSGGTGGSNGGTGSNSGDTGGSSETSPTQLPDIQGGPYVVKQIETLGGESISGVVCSVSQPFSVLSVTPHVTFSFYFVPKNAQQGTVAYAYSISSAGESHDASGTYTLSPVDKAGTLQLSLAVSDHVVFKGFDGNIPNRYKFNLVPSGGSPCP